MSETPLNITALNDFIFCPLSIYFHSLYGDMEKLTYQSTDQTNGTNAHRFVDDKSYSISNCIKNLEVYCERYNLIGKIDIYNKSTKSLIECKKKVKQIYDGYIFQLYAQYFAMTEMGYQVEKLVIYSIDDKKNYPINLPESDPEMLKKFENTVNNFENFDFDGFIQINHEKCAHCIYAPYCDREV